MILTVGHPQTQAQDTCDHIEDTRVDKPKKPTPEFPLFPHPNGKWAKKIHGKTRYFGPWNDPNGALERYEAWLKLHAEQASIPVLARPAKPGAIEKPKKPYPEFPLYAHASRRWAKTIRGITRYFGPWDDPQAALDKYLRERDDLYAGREPRQQDTNGLTVKELVNRFLYAKELELHDGKIEQRTWDDYDDICGRLLGFFKHNPYVTDIQPEDFRKLAVYLRKGKRRQAGASTQYNNITRARVVFNFAWDDRLIPAPVNYGKGFRKPSSKELRAARNKKPRKDFRAKEIRALIDAAHPQMKAMILLGINCGLGNTDCAKLHRQALKLKRGWLVFPRPKTEVPRRCPLWQETIDAVKAVLRHRKEPKDAAFANLVFLTRLGAPWTSKCKKGDSPITKEMAKLLKKLHLERLGRNFYGLRHTFQTIGEETNDLIAVDFIMGHTPKSDDMRSVYREKMKKRRLLRVTAHVHKWLFNDNKPLATADALAVPETAKTSAEPTGGS